jgi:hypothetical protein
MGEHKIDLNKITRQVAEALTKHATDNGKLLEVGWISMMLHVIPKDAPESQVAEMRKAFFCGAEHLFQSLMSILDPGKEPTEKDMDRMSLIHTELKAFRMDVTNTHAAPGRRQ